MSAATKPAARTSSEVMASLDYILEAKGTTKAALNALEDQEQETRRELTDTMTREGITSMTDQRTGRTATLKPVRKYVIEDQDRLRSSLNDIGELGNCLRLDARAVERVIKQRGILPGAKEEVSRQLSIGAPKGGR